MKKNLLIVLLSSLLLGSSYVLKIKMDQLDAQLVQLAQLKSAMTALRIKHEKSLLKTKIRERAKRAMAVVPVLGLAALGWFEKKEYEEWKRQHPRGNLQQYTTEMSALISEMGKDYYAEIKKDIPEMVSMKARLWPDPSPGTE